VDPPLWLRGLAGPLRYRDWGRLAPHLRFVERSCRKLARESFHGMTVYQARMERKQGFLFRCVDVVMELFAMAAVISRARQMVDDRDPEAERALALADLFCRTARRKVRRLFAISGSTRMPQEPGRGHRDAGRAGVAREGRHGYRAHPEAFKTRSLVERRAAEAGRDHKAAADA